MSSSGVSSTERFTGRVKWFNNRAGYGFITLTDGQQSGKDVFVHHSAIGVNAEQYKYLVQGEYVEFVLTDTGGVGDHEFQAGSVSGINGGKLMCETRHEVRSARSQHRSSPTPPPASVPVSMVPIQSSGRGSGRNSGRGSGRNSGRASGRGRGGSERAGKPHA